MRVTPKSLNPGFLHHFGALSCDSRGWGLLGAIKAGAKGCYLYGSQQLLVRMGGMLLAGYAKQRDFRARSVVDRLD